jgi:hypothetical protein
LAYFSKISTKHTTFYDIPKKFDIFWKIFFENFAFFSHLRIWPFETTYGQIWPFLFSGPGNPDTIQKCSDQNFSFCMNGFSLPFFEGLVNF